MTTLEEALLEENESLTQMIESERNEYESQKRALIEKYEKELSNLRQQATELAQYVKNLSDDCNDALSNALQKQKDMYDNLMTRLEERLRRSEEELQNLRVKYDALQMDYEKLKKDVENL